MAGAHPAKEDFLQKSSAPSAGSHQPYLDALASLGSILESESVTHFFECMLIIALYLFQIASKVCQECVAMILNIGSYR